MPEQLTAKERRLLENAARQLNGLILSMRKRHPEACLYLSAHGIINAMSGPSHDAQETPQYHLVMDTARVGGLTGGDW